MVCEIKVSAAEIEELATHIYEQRFFLNLRLNQKLGERIMFLCPLEGTEEKRAISFIGVQENKRLVVFTLKENGNSKGNLSLNLHKVPFDLAEYIQNTLDQDALVAMDVLSMMKETYWLGSYKDFINIYLTFYTKQSNSIPDTCRCYTIRKRW